MGKCIKCSGIGISYTQPFGLAEECFLCKGTGNKIPNLEKLIQVQEAKGRYLRQLQNIFDKDL